MLMCSAQDTFLRQPGMTATFAAGQAIHPINRASHVAKISIHVDLVKVDKIWDVGASGSLA